jgi:hypothetical protein
MNYNFNDLKVAVAKNFERMSKHTLFRSAVTKDALWETYLSSFPEGSNPIMKERREHDCVCCKQFIRSVGNAVAVIDGKLVSIWDDVKINDGVYQVVADALSALVHSNSIADVFYTDSRTAGTTKTFQDTLDGVKTWDHFFVNVDKKFVMQGDAIPSKLSVLRSSYEVYLRALNELTQDSVETVLELINQNSLYRGSEQTFVLTEFLKRKIAFSKLKTDLERQFYGWNSSKDTPGSVTGIRNSAIGNLLIDLSNDVDLEKAVKSYEVTVAPANYKRPTALVTKGMIDKAKKAIESAGYTSALERRYAVVGDITVNNLLFVDRATRKAITGDVFDLLSDSVVSSKKNLDKIESVSIKDFIENILPTATSLEVMVENSHANNFVSLIAPVDPSAKNMFKWDNKFSWSYAGDVTDSIKERVKAAGGNVTGEFCNRLAWYNSDDLDFHMKEPTGYEIYFASRGRESPAGGDLDVDANGGSGMMEKPVENIFYQNISSMKEGDYCLSVHQFSKRNTANHGFEVEIEIQGTTYNFVSDVSMPSGKKIEVAKFNYSRAKGLVVTSSLKASTASKVIWNVPTNTFKKVNAVMLSPNYWDDFKVGNEHYFFMIDGCANEQVARGFYNEFLSEDLSAHRKVMEMVGSKMKTATSESQLSGLGFSSTQRGHLVCKVVGKFTRTIKVLF